MNYGGQMLSEIAFSDNRLDRADHMRTDPERLTAMERGGTALVLALDGLSPVLDAQDRLVWNAPCTDFGQRERVFLGLRDGVPLFVLVPEGGDDRPAYLQRPDWAAISRLSADELALYGGARSLADWHARHRFCARCGAPSVLTKGGWQRNCPSCKAQHFPRTDPVAIMLVEHEGALLLGRGAQFPPRSFSALAGFIEPGETIEQAVAREVFEEVGVRTHSVSYVASQPWPFPSQLMIGCHAFARDRALIIDRTEIEDARWFTREEVAEAVEEGGDTSSFRAPPSTAIANTLLCWWLEKEGQGAA